MDDRTLHGEGKARRVGSSPLSPLLRGPPPPSQLPDGAAFSGVVLRATAGPQVTPCMWLSFPPGEPGRVSRVQCGEARRSQPTRPGGERPAAQSFLVGDVVSLSLGLGDVRAGRAVHSRSLGWHPGLAVAWYQLNHVCHESTRSAQRPWDEGAENLTQAL